MIQFRAERGWSFDGYQAWILDYRNGQTYIAKPVKLEFEPHPEGHILPEPTLQIRADIARELIPQLKKSLAGFTWFDDKEDYEVAKRVEKAMQAHIDSLKLVVDRVVTTRVEKP